MVHPGAIERIQGKLDLHTDKLGISAIDCRCDEEKRSEFLEGKLNKMKKPKKELNEEAPGQYRHDKNQDAETGKIFNLTIVHKEKIPIESNMESKDDGVFGHLDQYIITPDDGADDIANEESKEENDEEASNEENENESDEEASITEEADEEASSKEDDNE